MIDDAKADIRIPRFIPEPILCTPSGRLQTVHGEEILERVKRLEGTIESLEYALNAIAAKLGIDLPEIP